MPNKTIHSAHDKVFKAFLTVPQTAREFLDIYLPQPLKSQCDLSSLQLQPESLIEEDLQTRYSDVLYSLKTTSGQGYVYCLIEHQSSPDKHMAFRLMQYAIKVMQRHLDSGKEKKKENKLPLVVPMLFYHGKRSPYPYSMDWFDCFQQAALARQLYSQPFLLIDITVIPDEEIMNHKGVALLELVQKHIRVRDMMELVDALVTLLLKGYTTEKQAKGLMEYLIQTGETESVSELLNNLSNQAPEHEGMIMTIAEQLQRQGEERGLQQGLLQGEQRGLLRGRQETQQQIIQKMLESGLDTATICELTGLTESELAKLIN